MDQSFEFDEPSRPLVEGRHYFIVHFWIKEKGRGTLANRYGDAYTVHASDLNRSCDGYLEPNEVVSARVISQDDLEDVVVVEGPRAIRSK